MAAIDDNIHQSQGEPGSHGTIIHGPQDIDDPLRMIPTLLANRGLAGVVLGVDSENFEQGPKNLVRRPLLEIETTERCAVPVGKTLWWTRTANKREYTLTGVRHHKGGSTVTLQLETSANQELPEPGTTAIFSVHNTHGDPPLKLPPHAPWTHLEAETTPLPLEGARDEGSWE